MNRKLIPGEKPSEETVEEHPETDLEKLSKKELAVMAKEKDIDIKELNKLEIIAAIEEKDEQEE